MRIVIIGAGPVAVTPAILSGLATGARHGGATVGLLDADAQEDLDIAGKHGMVQPVGDTSSRGELAGARCGKFRCTSREERRRYPILPGEVPAR
jgi:hypothetical protein